MSIEIKGHIKEIGKTQEFGKNGFQKRQVVITTDDKYPQDLAIDFVQDKTGILDKYGEGQLVTIGTNIRGNEYNGRYFVNLIGWKINADEDSQPASAVNKYKQEPELPNEPEEPDGEVDDSDDFPY